MKKEKKKMKKTEAEQYDIFYDILEEWQDIAGYEGLYQASTMGRIKSLWHGEKILEPDVNEFGYECVKLYDRNGKSKRLKVHRLVGQCFVAGYDENHCTINHKTENKRDNSIYNLEWISLKENLNYGTRNLRIGRAHAKPFIQYSPYGRFIRYYNRLEDLKLYGFSIAKVSQCLHGEAEMYNDYRWEYAEKRKLK